MSFPEMTSAPRTDLTQIQAYQGRYISILAQMTNAVENKVEFTDLVSGTSTSATSTTGAGVPEGLGLRNELVLYVDGQNQLWLHSFGVLEENYDKEMYTKVMGEMAKNPALFAQ